MKSKSLISLVCSFLLTVSLQATQTEACVNIQGRNICMPQQVVDSCGGVFYWVLAEVANEILSEATYQVCVKVVGEDNQEICDAIQAGMEFLGGLHGTGKKSVKLFRELIELRVERKTNHSQLYFVTESLSLAYNIFNTLEGYQKIKAIPWSNLRHNCPDNSPVHSRISTISNVTSKHVTLELSRDGKKWEVVHFSPAKKNGIRWDSKKFLHSYGFCRGENFCSTQLYIGGQYKIRYNPHLKQYYLSTE